MLRLIYRFLTNTIFRSLWIEDYRIASKRGFDQGVTYYRLKYQKAKSIFNSGI